MSNAIPRHSGSLPKIFILGNCLAGKVENKGKSGLAEAFISQTLSPFSLYFSQEKQALRKTLENMSGVYGHDGDESGQPPSSGGYGGGGGGRGGGGGGYGGNSQNRGTSIFFVLPSHPIFLLFLYLRDGKIITCLS